MCLAVPAKLVEMHQEHEATADLHGNRLRVNTTLVPEARRGDWVLIHAGFAIQCIDEDEAAETWALIQDVTTPPANRQGAGHDPTPA